MDQDPNPHHLPPEHVSSPIRPEPGAHAQIDDMDAKGIMLIGSFLMLMVVVLVIPLMAYFHYYQYQLEDQRMVNLGAWAAGLKAQQEADLAPHYVDSAHTQATIGLNAAEQTVLADYTSPVNTPMFAAAPPPPAAQSAASPSSATPTSTSSGSTPAAAAVPLHVLGQQLFQSVGCSACHTVDGSKGIGPTLKNVAGYPQQLTNGKTVIADYAYLRYMILHPDQDMVVKGFPPIMTDLSDQIMDPSDPKDTKLNAIIWYINTLSDKSSKATQPPIPDTSGG
ncbi:MAG TPA: c-type cytochrome [Phycisphaerae bacterium]|nr:c-type cytochrome [Phycisphaerae bacterium]